MIFLLQPKSGKASLKTLQQCVQLLTSANNEGISSLRIIVIILVIYNVFFRQLKLVSFVIKCLLITCILWWVSYLTKYFGKI